MLLNWRWQLGKLGTFSGKEICQILSRYNFLEVRRRGSHIVMQKKTSEGTTTVPVPNHKEIKIGTLRSIIRQSGLPKSEFVV